MQMSMNATTRIMVLLAGFVGSHVADSAIVDAEEPCVCSHAYFGSPKEGVAPFAWKMPASALEHLTKQADQTLFADKQYFWCPNTFSSLTYSNGTGFRFIACPYSWAGFRPVRVSRAELTKRLMNLNEIETLLDSPSVTMGVVEVRVTAVPGGGMMGNAGGVPGMTTTSPTPQGG